MLKKDVVCCEFRSEGKNEKIMMKLEKDVENRKKDLTQKVADLEKSVFKLAEHQKR